MILHADEPGMLGDLHGLGQLAIGRHARETQAYGLEPILVVDVDLVAMPMPLTDPLRGIYLGDAASLREDRLVGAEPHGATQVAVRLALLEHVAAHPFGHEAD